jgi:hypothetical protein
MMPENEHGMVTGIWNTGKYAGFADHPDLQLTWFIDHALAVWASRVAAGNLTFGNDPQGWGDWIADVEWPAEQFRSRYQLRLALSRPGAARTDQRACLVSTLSRLTVGELVVPVVEVMAA